MLMKLIFTPDFPLCLWHLHLNVKYFYLSSIKDQSPFSQLVVHFCDNALPMRLVLYTIVYIEFVGNFAVDYRPNSISANL